VAIISVMGGVVLAAASIAETRSQIDETYMSQGQDLAKLIQANYLLDPSNRAHVIDYLDQLIITHPTLLRVRLFSAPAGSGPKVWASTYPPDLSLNVENEDFPSVPTSTETAVTGQPAMQVMIPTPQTGRDVTSIGLYFSLAERDTALTSLTRRLVVDAVIVTLVDLAALAAALYLLVLRRVRKLDDSAVAVAEGDLSVHLPEGDEPRGRDELVNVAHEFDHMVSAVRERAAKEQEDAERLRALDAAKSTLLHAVSHDLRSPLTSVLGSASTLQQADQMGLSEKERASLTDGIVASARKMHRLVSDLLDLDRIDRGILEPEKDQTDLAELARRVVVEPSVAGDGRSIELDVEQVVIPVDAPKVERIVENLLTNAAKHTPPGTAVCLRVHPEGSGALIRVEDTGHGVPDEMKSEIFEPFRQGYGSGAGGVGIGLSLVARFAELHGGRAWVEDRPGGGASFRVFLPGGDVGVERSQQPMQQDVDR
jgi:signal transduction histidine kinase